MSPSAVLRAIETFQVGPSHAGHSRTVYAGAGMEVWEEIRAPLHLGAYMLGRFPSDTITVFLQEVPETRPEGSVTCGREPVMYGDGTVPQVVWHGRDALRQGWAWLAAQGVVPQDEPSRGPDR